MAEALLTIWPLYLVGAVIIFFGFLALNTWIRGLTGKGPDQPSTILAASVAAFLLGSATVALAIGIDQAQTTTLNTRTLVYHVDVRINGTAPVRLLLPAPGEPAFFEALNVTQGASSLRLNRTPTDTNVVLVASSNVTFDVRTQAVVSAFNGTITRIRLPSPVGPTGREVNTTIEMTAGSPDTRVDLVLDIQLLEACRFTFLEVSATVVVGAAEYVGERTFAVC
jgi:FlaG/FlaF family flagellin (archaellin)